MANYLCQYVIFLEMEVEFHQGNKVGAFFAVKSNVYKAFSIKIYFGEKGFFKKGMKFILIAIVRLHLEPPKTLQLKAKKDCLLYCITYVT